MFRDSRQIARKSARKISRAIAMVDSLEERVLLSYTPFFFGNSAELDGDGTAGETITVAAINLGGTTSGSTVLEWNDGSGFKTSWDSGGDPTATIPVSPGSTIYFGPSGSNQHIVIGTPASPASTLLATFVDYADGEPGDTVVIDDSGSTTQADRFSNPYKIDLAGVIGEDSPRTIFGPGIHFEEQSGGESSRESSPGGISLYGSAADDTYDVYSTYFDQADASISSFELPFGGESYSTHLSTPSTSAGTAVRSAVTTRSAVTPADDGFSPIQEPFTVVAGSGKNTVYVGNDPRFNGYSLESISGSVFVTDPVGSVSLVLNDQGDEDAVAAAVTSTSVSLLSPAPINYTPAASNEKGGVSSLTLLGGYGAVGGVYYNIQSTSATVPFTLVTAGDDDNVTIGNDGSVAGIRGAIGLSNQSGGTIQLVINASADTNSTTATLSANAGTATLTGLAPAPISYPVSSLYGLNVNNTAGANNLFTVNFTGGTPIPSIYGFYYNGGYKAGSGSNSTSILRLAGTFPAGFQTAFGPPSAGAVNVPNGVGKPTSYLNYSGLSPIGGINTLTGKANTAFTNMVLGTFLDNNPLANSPAAYTGTISFGDGSPLVAAMFAFNPTTKIFSVLGSHKYVNKGTYNITITLTVNGVKTIIVSKITIS